MKDIRNEGAKDVRNEGAKDVRNEEVKNRKEKYEDVRPGGR